MHVHLYRGGQANVILKSANPQILGFIPLSQTRNFFVMPVRESQIRKFLRNSAHLFTWFLLSTHLKKSFVCFLWKEKRYVFEDLWNFLCPEIIKIGSGNRKSAKVSHFCGSSANPANYLSLQIWQYPRSQWEHTTPALCFYLSYLSLIYATFQHK